MTQPYIGELRIFSFDFSPRGWASAAGQQLGIAQNQALFALLGTTYGGNGVTTFALPDLRGRAALGLNSTYPWGAVGGTEQVTLNSTQIPQHFHQLVGTSATASKKGTAAHSMGADTSTTINFYTAANQAQLTQLAPNALLPAGNNQPHSNMQPYLVLNVSIALQGLFPSRN